MAFKKRTKPIKHPKLEDGWTRIDLPEIEVTTDKAYLFDFDGVKKWCPKSVCKVRYGSHLLKEDDKDVLDIQSWWYDKNF